MATIGSTSVGGFNLSLTGSSSISSLSYIRSLRQLATLQRNGLNEINTQLRDLGQGLERLAEVAKRARLSGGGSSSAASLSGTTRLDLSTSDSYSAIASSEEINTTATSFTPTDPTWTGSSSAQITVSGTYTGSTDETLTFSAYRDRNVGGNKILKIDVYDGSGDYVEQMQWAAGSPNGTEVTNSLGLTISFGGGNMVEGDTFTVDVSASTGTDLDPDVALDEVTVFEDGVSISNGSFTLNGQTISVKKNDTLNDVIDTINTSGAGVTATFVDDVFTLTADDLGDVDVTPLGDTSGLIAALKLDTSTQSDGSIDELNSQMSTVSALSSVGAGSFTINGETITISSTDSLQDVLDAVNASDAGVTASYSTSTGKVTFGSIDTAASMSISGDTSGLLAAIGVSEGTTEPVEGSKRGSRLAARELAAAIADLQDPLNALFGDTEYSEDVSLERIAAQSKVRAAFGLAFEDAGFDMGSNDFGLELNLDAEGELAMDMSLLDVRALEEAMRFRPTEMKYFLFGSNQREGMLSLLEEAVGAAQDEIEETMGDAGTAVSLYV